MDLYRSFFGQVPFIFVSSIVALYGLPGPSKDQSEASPKPRIRDLDFAGILTFAATMISFMFLLQAAGMKDDSLVVGVWTLTLAFALSGSVFVAIEAFWARNPLIPMHLLIQKLGAHCLIQVLLFSGRVAVYYFPSPSFVTLRGLPMI